MIDLSQKTIFELLLKAFLLGAALGLLYDGIRFSKMLCGVSYSKKNVEAPKSSRAKTVFLYAVTFRFDLFFWVIFCISAVLLFYNVSGGVFRASVIPAMLFGLFVYYISLGRLMLYLSARFVILLKKICRFAVKILAVPLLLAKKILFSLYHLTIGKILGRIKEERMLRAQKNAQGSEGEMPLCECDREGESEYGERPYRSEGRSSCGGRR